MKQEGYSKNIKVKGKISRIIKNILRFLGIIGFVGGIPVGIGLLITFGLVAMGMNLNEFNAYWGISSIIILAIETLILAYDCWTVVCSECEKQFCLTTKQMKNMEEELLGFYCDSCREYVQKS